MQQTFALVVRVAAALLAVRLASFDSTLSVVNADMHEQTERCTATRGKQ